jgi:hypothetical protein
MALPNFSNALYVSSLIAQIPVGEDSIVVEKEFEYGTKPTGAIVFVSNCKYGDIGKLEIVHPTAGVVGEVGMVHLPEGNREITVTVEDATTEVSVGLKYRLTLTAIDTLGRDVIVWLLVKR